MVSKPVWLHPEAEREYQEALAWYRDRNLVVASDFELAVVRAVDAIEGGPTAVAELLRRIQAVRVASVSVQRRVSGTAFKGSCFSQSRMAGVGQGTGENEWKFDFSQ